MILVDTYANKVVNKVKASVLPELRLSCCEHKFKAYSNLVVVFMFVAPVILSLLYLLSDLKIKTAQLWVDGAATALVVIVGIFLLFWQFVYEDSVSKLREDTESSKMSVEQLKQDYMFAFSIALELLDSVFVVGDISFKTLMNICADGIKTSCSQRFNSPERFAVNIYEYDSSEGNVRLVGVSRDKAVHRIVDNDLYRYGLFVYRKVDSQELDKYYFVKCLKGEVDKYVLLSWKDMVENFYWAHWKTKKQYERAKNGARRNCRLAGFRYNQYMAIPIVDIEFNKEILIEIIAYDDAFIAPQEQLLDQCERLSGVYGQLFSVVYEIADKGQNGYRKECPHEEEAVCN